MNKLKLLQKYVEMFGGTLGKYAGSGYTIEVQKNPQPFHAKPFPISTIHKPNLKQEVDKKMSIKEY